MSAAIIIISPHNQQQYPKPINGESVNSIWVSCILLLLLLLLLLIFSLKILNPSFPDNVSSYQFIFNRAVLRCEL
ncbi:hypothetical protein CASFOL_039642 [Castilleja foliolosa]|uniref:Uncharacterized protein n=1 Tax=Castilleja foliolosa TaxID=1961234 RepID=A0ABD3BG60_9LAMI